MLKRTWHLPLPFLFITVLLTCHPEITHQVKNLGWTHLTLVLIGSLGVTGTIMKVIGDHGPTPSNRKVIEETRQELQSQLLDLEDLAERCPHLRVRCQTTARVIRKQLDAWENKTQNDPNDPFGHHWTNEEIHRESQNTVAFTRRMLEGVYTGHPHAA